MTALPPSQVCLDDELFMGLRLGYGEAFLKVTRQCNNRCRFCCDRTFQDGHVFPRDRAIATLEEGRRHGLENVVFSGGEPTLHPDILSLLEAAGELGYRRISLITNGRYFAYREACQRAVRAGMTTAVITLLSDRPELHDYLCGVPGAFAQSTRAVKNLVAMDASLVSVVITVTRPVVTHLPRIVRFLHGLGVGGAALHRVAPLPWVAADPTIFFPPDMAQQPLRQAIELAHTLGLPLTVKNFPPAFLEGHEHLISESEEFFPEVRDTERRVGLFRSLVVPGETSLCQDLDCATCYRQPFCDYLRDLARRWRNSHGDRIRVDPERCGPGGLARVEDSGLPLALACAPASDGADLDSLARFARERGWQDRVTHLELERAPDTIPETAFPKLRAVAVRHAQGLDASIARRPRLTHEIRLNQHTQAWVATHLDLLRSRGEGAVLTLDPHERLRGTQVEEIDLRAFFRKHSTAGITLVGVPPCLAPSANHLPRPRVLEAQVFGAEGVLDPLEACHLFLRDGWLDKRASCADCPQQDSCEGLPVNTLTAFGYQQLRPPSKG